MSPDYLRFPTGSNTLDQKNAAKIRVSISGCWGTRIGQQILYAALAASAISLIKEENLTKIQQVLDFFHIQHDD